MIKLHRKTLSTSLVLIAVISLSGCSTAGKIRGILGNSADVNYQNNQAIKELEVPPDLTQPEFDRSFDLPTGVVSAVSLKNGTAMPQSTSDNESTVRRGDLSSVRTVGGKTVLQVNDTYPRSLILTGIILTRMGFSMVNKSPLGDVIVAKYNGSDVNVDDNKNGFFSKSKNLIGLGGNDKALSRGKDYRITIANEQGTPIVRVAPVAGVLSDAANTKIITLLNNTFNR